MPTRYGLREVLLAVVVFGGYVSPGLTGYPENVNLFSDISCAPCGLRRRCLHGTLKCMEGITPEEICERTLGLLKEDGSPRGLR